MTNTDKYFLCLANSYKNGNRCLAGVEVRKIGNEYEIKTDSWGHPIWFRPVNRWTESGEIPNDESTEIGLFDVVLATNVESCPDGAQIENYYYNELCRIETVEADDHFYATLSNTNRKLILGNLYASISDEQYYNMDYSIILIKAEDVECYLKEREFKQPQPRIRFSYKQNCYDLPVTDPGFRKLMENDILCANSFQTYYLTISLSVAFEEDNRHYKLIAGVFYC